MGWHELQSFGSERDQDVGSCKHDNVSDSYIKRLQIWLAQRLSACQRFPSTLLYGRKATQERSGTH
jgi:hypothetical protein